MTLILEQYGIRLRRINIHDIELIRQKRNLPEIRKNMGYKKYISEKKQLKWFYSIDNKFNYYFMIEVDETSIGVINVKNVNLKEGYGEGGIFIWDFNYHNTSVPLISSLILLDFIFNVINVGAYSFVQVLQSNYKSIQYNRFLGYSLVPYQNKKENQLYVLSKEVFNDRAIKLRIAARNYFKTNGELNVKGQISDKNIEQLNTYLTKLNS